MKEQHEPGLERLVSGDLITYVGPPALYAYISVYLFESPLGARGHGGSRSYNDIHRLHPGDVYVFVRYDRYSSGTVFMVLFSSAGLIEVAEKTLAITRFKRV